MTSRVLIADDSLTIQKVIGITLANSGYELVECVNEDELFKKIESDHFDLILLDFNLSDTKSGYELSKKINSIMPSAAIIVMLGTFDSIDESQFAASGIADKIVKPFESSKFIKKCHDLLEGFRPTPKDPSESKNEDGSNDLNLSESDDLDHWTVEAPIMHDKMEKEPTEPAYTSSEAASLDPLSSEIEGWGFSQTTQIEDKFQKSFPPVIEDEFNAIDRLQSSSSFIHDEENNDLDLDLNSGLDLDLDSTSPSYTVPEELNRSLLTEIDEDISAEAFWAVDEVLPIESEEYEDILKTNLDEVTADLTEIVYSFNEAESKLADEVTSSKELNEVVTAVHMDQDELVEKLKLSLRPMIEEMVKEFCRQSAEKVAWEVIPDLAENLIRKEIKDISDSI